MKGKVCFKDLSMPLKVLVVLGWINFIWFFLVGFAMGLLGVLE